MIAYRLISMSGEGESTAQVFVAAWLVTMLWKGYISDASRHGHGFSEKPVMVMGL